MRKGLVVGLVLLSIAAPLDAKPRWKDWKFWVVTGVAVGSTAFQVHSQNSCRARNDVAVCFGGYGSPKAMDGLVIGASAGFYALSLGSRHWGVKEWSLPSLGMSAFNVGSGIKETRAWKPKGTD